MLVLDVDGVLTDGGMYYSNGGDEFKKFNTKDGLGIKMLIECGVVVAFLSNGKNDVLIKNRAALLGVQKVYVGFDKKIIVLNEWLKEMGLQYNNVSYIGDDINDLEVIEHLELTACPEDAVDEVKTKVKYILGRKGGEGCVREFIDNYLLH